MKKMKRVLCTLVSALAIAGNVTAFASCDSGNIVTGDVEVVAYDGSAVTVNFYHTMGKTLRDVLDKYIPEFNKLYPNITINHQSFGDYPGLRDQISTELSAKNSPSLAYCYSDHVALYNNSSAVLTLDNFISSDLVVTRADGTTETMGYTQTQLDDFVASYYAEGSVYGDNKMYSLPYMKSTEVLYYNKTYFDAKGYTPPTTWDEMEALCAKIKAEEPNNIPLGYDSEANWFITMCEQLNSPYTSAVPGQKFLFNNETNWNFVKKFREWYQKGYVTTEEISGGYTSDLFTETDKDEVKTYMTIGSSAGASYQCPDPLEGQTDENGNKIYPFEVGVAMPPQMDVNNAKVISQGPSLCLFKKTNSQEIAAAWLFAKFMTTYVPLQADFSMASGYAPVIQSVETDEIYAEFLDTADGNANLQASCVKQNLAQKDACFVSPAFNGSSEARDEVGLLMQRCFVNKAENELALIESYFKASVEELRYYHE